VTFLDARRLSAEEYRHAGGNDPEGWRGGGLRMAFLVENRRGQPIGPVLGEVRVFLDGIQYNPVTNAMSKKPFAPYIIIDDVDDFFASPYGRSIGYRPTPRPQTIYATLEVLIRGTEVRLGASGIVEVEQGATRLPEASVGRRRPNADDVIYHWFRFRLPALH
jgi:hypothetical protein